MAAPRRVFLVHGEPPAARGMADHLKKTLGWEATVPAIGESFDL
jgi:metallo-beta-lactamase family protein